VSIFSFIVVIVPFITFALTSVTINMGKPLSERNISFRFWKQMITRDSILSSTMNIMIADCAAAFLGIIIS
ncbi:iron ABC transporter permease, partial [Parvimonas sp. D9]|nr:iron ABC transporter permease [Parvimonas sp. D9]